MLNFVFLLIGCIIGFFAAGMCHASADFDRTEESYHNGYSKGYEDGINQSTK